MPHFLARLAQARAATRDWDGAMRAMDEAIALASPFERKNVRAAARAAANRGRHRGRRNATGIRTARPVLGEYRAQGQFVFMRSRPDLAARLANHALQHGIETEYVRTLIERSALVAPA
jgi:hypothetical protein